MNSCTRSYGIIFLLTWRFFQHFLCEFMSFQKCLLYLPLGISHKNNLGGNWNGCFSVAFFLCFLTSQVIKLFMTSALNASRVGSLLNLCFSLLLQLFIDLHFVIPMFVAIADRIFHSLSGRKFLKVIVHNFVCAILCLNNT